MKKRWCWYCKHRSERFRMPGNEGYVNCCHPDPYVAYGREFWVNDNGQPMPVSCWASVRKCWKSCKSFEEQGNTSVDKAKAEAEKGAAK